MHIYQIIWVLRHKNAVMKALASFIFLTTQALFIKSTLLFSWEYWTINIFEVIWKA